MTCLNGTASWGICTAGRFLCESDGDIKDQDPPIPTELQSTESPFCGIDKIWWSCLETSVKFLRHPLGMRALECLDDETSMGICNPGEFLCQVPVGTWLEIHVPIVPNPVVPPSAEDAVELAKQFRANTRSQSGEDEYAWTHLFYGRSSLHVLCVLSSGLFSLLKKLFSQFSFRQSQNPAARIKLDMT
jgi:hypothetical protein